MWIAALILFILFIIIVPNVRIVPQATEYVIEFLGKYKTTWGAGLHVKIPVIEKISHKIKNKIKRPNCADKTPIRLERAFFTNCLCWGDKYSFFFIEPPPSTIAQTVLQTTGLHVVAKE